MLRKHILIVLQSFSMGGITSSLHSLLSVIDPQKVEVDVFARCKVGDFGESLPNCRILSENLWLSSSLVESNVLKKLCNMTLHAIRKILAPIGIDMFKYYGKHGGMQIHSDQYDAVIGFAETMAPIICYYPAQKRIIWVHCDYRRYTQQNESRYYDRIDTIVCVSEFVKGIFSEIYPQYTSKTIAIHNVINVEDLKRKAQEVIADDEFDKSCFTIVSCGRLDPVKQFSLIPSIAAQIKKDIQQPFHWYIIGGGNAVEQDKIKSEISKCDVADCVFSLGMKNNPYPYMANANLYVCTSSSESFPMVVNEAKALGVYVVSNKFPSVKESIRNTTEGQVCTIDYIPSVIGHFIEEQTPDTRKECASETNKILNQVYSIL